MRNYQSHFKVYATICEDASLAPLPVTDTTFALFLAVVKEQDRIHGASILNYISAIKKHHLWFCGEEFNPCPLLRDAVQGFKILSSSSVVTRSRYALTSIDFLKIVTATLASPRLDLLEACAYVSYGFLFLLRAGSITAIRVRDVEFFTRDGVPHTLIVHIRHAKATHSFDPAVRKPLSTNHKFFDNTLPNFLTPIYAHYQQRQQANAHFLFSSATDRFHGLAATMLAPNDNDADPSASANITAALSIALAAASIDVPEFDRTTSHCLRRGGASEIQAISRNPTTTQLWGNWKQLDSIKPYLNRGALDTAAGRHVFGFLLPQ